MKKLLSKFILSFIVSFALSCDSDKVSREQELINSLIGKWEEISPCMSCSTVTFKNNDTIELKFYSDPKTYYIRYSIDGEYITVIRDWDIGSGKETNKIKVIFKSKDTLELLQFKATDAVSTTGYDDIQLKRM